MRVCQKGQNNQPGSKQQSIFHGGDILSKWRQIGHISEPWGSPLSVSECQAVGLVTEGPAYSPAWQTITEIDLELYHGPQINTRFINLLSFQILLGFNLKYDLFSDHSEWHLKNIYCLHIGSCVCVCVGVCVCVCECVSVGVCWRACVSVCVLHLCPPNPLN